MFVSFYDTNPKFPPFKYTYQVKLDCQNLKANGSGKGLKFADLLIFNSHKTK